MDLYELGSSLFGRSRAEDDNVFTDATTRTYIGTATSDSSDGSVYVALSEDVTMPDDYDGEHGVGVEMPTTVGVSEGDDVVVTVFGGGTMKAPVVTGNPGWGDDVETRVTEAHDLAASVEGIAQEAKEVAEATGQNFWPDTDGVHVTQVTQDEWNDSTSPNYHSGANVLLNALGQLFRDGLNNLLALVGGTNPGVAIYDGQGNNAENIVASFDGDEVSLGRNSDTSTIDMCGGVFTFEVDNSDTTKPRATIRVNSSSGVTAVPTLRLTAGSGSSQYGFDIAGASAPYPISVVAGGGKVVNMGGLGLQTYAFDLAGIDGGGTFRADDGIYMVTNSGTNFWSTVPGTVLWSSGGWYMAANQTANLAYNVSTCPTGIVLHFQPYTSGTTRNYFHQYCFVPKTTVAASAGAVHNFTLCNTDFAKVGMKALRIYDDRIVGDDSNDDTGTASGITFDNKYWVLTQVIAV